MTQPVFNSGQIQSSKVSNPFSTRFVSPNKLPYLFACREDESRLTDVCIENAWFGQIIGPHGSGKTTLTYHLRRRLEQTFESVIRVTVRSSRTIKSTASGTNGQTAAIVIDGAERLSWFQFALLKSHCRQHQLGLLVTTHRRLSGLPVLFETTLDQQRLARVIGRLTTQPHDADQLQTLLETHGQNCREILMQLYDQWQISQTKIA